LNKTFLGYVLKAIMKLLYNDLARKAKLQKYYSFLRNVFILFAVLLFRMTQHSSNEGDVTALLMR